MKWMIFILTCFLSCLGIGQNSTFKKGNSLYAEGNYQEALNTYNKLVAADQLSAALFYNIGNTYYKLDELGESIWAYERALKINPGNDDIRFNLNFANQQTFDKIELQESSIGTWLKINLFRFSINTWSILSILFSVLLGVAIFLFFLSKNQQSKNIGLTLGFATLLLLVTSTILAYLHKEQIVKQDSGIITTEVVSVKTSPSETAPDSFELHEGTKVSLLRTNNNWIEIGVNENVGWVNRESVWKI